MLSCRLSRSGRIVALVGLVVLMVAVADPVWAQYLVSKVTTVPNTFPYLSPDLNQRNLLINAFAFQMSMFQAISGGGDLKALNYFALTGCLMGALLTIFNPKYRKAPIISTWLLLVVIMVFAPYGSKLLFYPASQDALSTTGSLTSLGASTTADCKGANASRCGFTPQLAAIHVAATVQLMFADVFNSMGWTGLMQRVDGEESLSKGEENVLPDDVLNADVPDYIRQCNKLGFDNLANIYAGVPATSTGTTGTGTTTTAVDPNAYKIAKAETVGGTLAYYDSFFKADMSNSGPPRTMQLFTDTEINNLGWSNEDKDAYEKGMTELYHGFYTTSPEPVKLGCSSSTAAASGNTTAASNSNCISVETAITKLDTAGFFKVSNGDGGHGVLYPGFIFTSTKAGNYSTAKDAIYDITAADARKCYVPEKSVTGSEIDPSQAADGLGAVVSQCQSSGNVTVPVNVLPEEQRVSYNELKGDTLNDVTGTPWAQASSLITRDPNSALMKMPVGIVKYDPVANKAGDTDAPKAQAVTSGKDCVADGKALINNIIDTTYGADGGRAPNYGNLAMMLKGTSTTPAVFTRDNITTVPESAGNTGVDTRVGQWLSVLNGRFRDSGITDSTDAKVRQALLLKIFLKKIEDSSNFVANNKNPQQTAAEKDAADASQRADVVGSTTLTYLGGGIAKFLGSWLAIIGSKFVGPLSQAIIYFLSILVDIAMLALIVLTPFLFLAGLFVPTMAIGVLTVAVMGAFVLKFVPVTLLILNNLGMMIYQFIGISGDKEASVMQAMIIIAMGGLYANLVGMTFFLLFKLGDPATILSRFTALDGAAKDVATKGMEATVALATAAAVLASGGAGAALGYGSLAGSARKAAAKLGIPPGMIDGAQSAMKQVSAKEDETGNGAGGAAKPQTPEELLAAAEQKAREDAYDADPNALGLEKQMEGEGFTPADIASFRSNGYLEKNGQMWTNDSGTLVSVGAASLIGATAAERAALARDENSAYGGKSPQQREIESQEAKMWTAHEEAQEIGADGLTNEQRAIKDQEKAAWDNYDESKPGAPGAGDNDAPATGPAGTGGGAAATATAVAGATIAQGTAPLQVSVVDGKLSSVGEVGNIQALAESSSSVQAMAADAEKKKLAQNIADGNMELNKMKQGASGEQVAAIEAYQEQRNAAQSSDDLLKADAGIPTEVRVAREEMRRKEGYSRNMNDQLAAEIANVDRRLANGGISSAHKQELTNYRKTLSEIDPVALTQGEMMAKMGTVDEMKKAMAIRGAADNMPGFLQTVGSGVYGAAAGVFGGAGKIPILGPAVGEIANEFYQAPERARAWNAAGGRKQFNQLKADAQRMGFYQKEMAPIAAGTQYQSMVAVGGFQAQADLARQTASEAVAKSRSQYEAMVINSQNNAANKGVNVGDVNFRNFMTAGELTGLGRMEAADRVASVRQEAYLMQGDSMTVKRAVIKGTDISAMDGNMQLKVKADGSPVDFEVKEVNTVMTAQSLAKFRGDLTTKRMASSYDDMMIAHYGLAEKQYLRGNVGWDETRDMNNNARAAATFARKDVSTDYLIGGHLKMVEGKLKFKDSQGQYNKLVEFRGDENRIKAEYIQNAVSNNPGGLNGVLSLAATRGDYKIAEAGKLAGAQLQTFQREALDKYATAMLKESGKLLKLEAIFDEAGANGTTKYEEKAFIAPAREATRQSKLNEAVIKEYSRMFEGVKTFDPAAFKSSPIRNGGVSAIQGDLVKTLTENLAFKIPKEDLGRVVSGLVKAFDTAPGSSKSFTNNVLAKIDPKNNPNAEAVEMVFSAVGVNKEGFAAAEKEFAREPAIWTAIKGLFTADKDSKHDDYYRVGSTAIDNDGAKHLNKDIEIVKVLKARRN